MVCKATESHVVRIWLRYAHRRLFLVMLAPRTVCYTPRNVSQCYYATFSGNGDHEIDLITLRRRSAKRECPDLDVPFRTSLDTSGSLNGLYDPSLVERALTKVSSKSDPGSGLAPQGASVAEFVNKFNRELVELTDFVRSSYSGKIKKLSQLNPVEISNVLYIFRDLYRKGKITSINPANLDSLDSMVSTFLALLEKSPDSARVPLAVCSLLEVSKLRLYYVDLYSSGIGNFLPELRVLSYEFNFRHLSSVNPVVEKISALVYEFSRFLKEHDASHDYDAEFFRVVIYVLRYKKLQDILLAVGQKNISPRDLLALTQDSEADAVQRLVADFSDEPQNLDDMIFIQHRNFFNVVYTAAGLELFDSIFARLYLEAEKPVYSEREKSQIDDFIETFLPLVCGGFLSIDTLQKEKFSCLPVRYNGRVLAPFKVSENIFENYDFSLGMLFDIPSRFYLLTAASSLLKKDFADASLDEISRAVLAVAKESRLLQDDAKELIAALKEKSSYSIRGFKILDTLAKNERLLRVAQDHDSHHDYVSKTYPEVIDLTVSLTSENGKPDLSKSSIRIDSLQLSNFKSELSSFKSKDLSNLPYTSLSDKTIIRLLKSRVSDVDENKICRQDSAVNPDNVVNFARLLELLSATFEVNGGSTTLLEEIVQDAVLKSLEKVVVESSNEYFQIPEYLQIHDFWSELEIFKTDELRSSFKNFSAERILTLLKKRIIEFNKALPNTNLASRMSLDNLPRFMQLSNRLEKLFEINNGNTEVLDAVLRSQYELQKLEFKLAEKKENQVGEEKVEPAVDSLYASGPYTQIPDKMHLHEFVEELKIFRHDDLRSSYKNFSAEKVLGLMQKRINEIYNDLPSTNLALRMSKKNLIAFINLHAKLEKLFAWNGGNTGILDTLIHSQSVFNDFEAKLASEKLLKSALPTEHKEYRQVSDDMVFEEFANELLAVKQKLGKKFKSATSEEVLQALQELTDAETSAEVKLIYGKLARNLIVLFKHNNDQTFVLDNVLLSGDAFKKFETKLAGAGSTESKFVMSEFLDSNKVQEPSIDYHDEDYVLSLLNSQSTPVDLDAQLLDAEASIKDAVSKALSKEENKLLDEDPEEYAAINNLTAQKIRESYVRSESKPDKGDSKPLDKESLEKFLKSTKKESEKRAESKWREQNAYEWSSSMYNRHRSVDSGNFFSPVFYGIKSSGFPMFPKTENKEYLVLTTSGQKFVSGENPLGANHVPEDMFAILNKFDEAELEKFSKNVRKLQKKHWKLIGGGGSERMLVLSRPQTGRKEKYSTRIKTVLASTGMVYLTLIGLNFWLDDAQHEAIAPIQVPVLENVLMENEKAKPVDKVTAQESIAESALSLKPSSPLWKRLLWRD